MEKKGSLGIGWSFPPFFNKQEASVEMVADKDDIRQSLMILFSTKPGERLIAPQYGCNFRPFAFEIVDTEFINNLKQTIYQAISNFETRIELLEVEINPSEDTLGQHVDVLLIYKIKKSGEIIENFVPIRLE